MTRGTRVCLTEQMTLLEVTSLFQIRGYVTDVVKM